MGGVQDHAHLLIYGFFIGIGLIQITPTPSALPDDPYDVALMLEVYQ